MKKFEFFDFVVYAIVVLFCIVMLYPFLNVISVSFSTYAGYLKNPVMIFPTDFDTSAFKYVITNNIVLKSYINTIIVTVAGVALGMLLIILTAYPLSKKDLMGKKIFMNIIVFTMIFGGGIIPSYILMKTLKLLNTYFAVILPSAMSAFNVILMKNFLESIPQSLEEAAKIDGAGDLQILFKIYVPLSKSIIATLCLFIAVIYWNGFFDAMLYLRDRSKWTLQLVLREIILANSAQSIGAGTDASATQATIMPITVKYASLIVVILPIMCVYPFLQKYFVKGVMVGAVKE